MNKREEHTSDLLRDYINPRVIEKAPEGFTSIVMAGVHSENIPVKKSGILSGRSLVPVISAAIIFILLLAVYLLPSGNESSLLTSAMESLKNIKISLPEFDFSSILSINLTGILSYVFIGILILSLFDRALNVVFHRGK